MLINFRYVVLIGLLVSFSIFSTPAKGNPPNTRAKPLDFFGNNLSDWVTISGNGEGGKFTWNILKNENPSPPDPVRLQLRVYCGEWINWE